MHQTALQNRYRVGMEALSTIETQHLDIPRMYYAYRLGGDGEWIQTDRPGFLRAVCGISSGCSCDFYDGRISRPEGVIFEGSLRDLCDMSRDLLICL